LTDRIEYYKITLDNIDHCKTRAKNPQSNGTCERFHKTVLNEFYRIAFRKKIYNSLYELQSDLDTWLVYYNEERTHSGRYYFGKTPMPTFIDSKPLAEEKMLNQNVQSEGVRLSG
jgi:transposase InsO family protein